MCSRYSIYKFLLKEKLLENQEDNTSLLRVYENFDHVISFHETKLDLAFAKCREYDIDIEIIDELPYIYESPLVGIFKNTN